MKQLTSQVVQKGFKPQVSLHRLAGIHNPRALLPILIHLVHFHHAHRVPQLLVPPQQELLVLASQTHDKYDHDDKGDRGQRNYDQEPPVGVKEAAVGLASERHHTRRLHVHQLRARTRLTDANEVEGEHAEHEQGCRELLGLVDEQTGLVCVGEELEAVEVDCDVVWSG